MGIAIRLADATFTKYIGVVNFTEDDPIVPDVPDVPDVPVPDTYPVTDNTLKGLYHLGGTLQESLVNHAEGGKTATAASGVNDPDGNPYVTFSGGESTQRIMTGITTDPANTTTIVALFRATDERAIVSNCAMSKAHISLTNAKVAYWKNAERIANTFDGGAIVSDAFALVALTASTSGARAVKSTANGNFTTLAVDGDGVDAWGTAAFSIGGASTNIGGTGTADIAFVSIHEGDMTDDQLKQIFNYVRNKYAVDAGLPVE